MDKRRSSHLRQAVVGDRTGFCQQSVTWWRDTVEDNGQVIGLWLVIGKCMDARMCFGGLMTRVLPFEVVGGFREADCPWDHSYGVYFAA